MRGSHAAAGFTVLLALLTGCATGDVAEPPSVAPTPTATPTPTLAAPVAPQSILPLACADLFSAEEASALVLEEVSVIEDESSVRNLSAIAARQAGLLYCRWGGEDATDNSPNFRLDVSILPDAAEAFDVGVWQVDDGATVYPAGSTTSEYRCYQILESYGACFVNVLVDGFWARAELSNRGEESGFTSAVADTTLMSIVDTLTAAIEGAAAPRAAWEPPAGALSGAICGGGTVPAGTGESLRYPEFVAHDRVVRPECTVTGASGTSYGLTVVVGGAWALPTMMEELRSPWYEVGPLAPVQLAGVEHAAYGCLAFCYVVADVGSSALSISGTPPGWNGGEIAGYEDAFLADVASLIPQIAAAG